MIQEMFTVGEIERLCQIADNLQHLSGPEVTRVLHRLLADRRIPHEVFLGGVYFQTKEEWVEYHMWIEVETVDGRMQIDYRLHHLLAYYGIPMSRKYQTLIPEGVFFAPDYPEITYVNGLKQSIPPIEEDLYLRMLTPSTRKPAFLSNPERLPATYNLEKSLELAEQIEVYTGLCWGNSVRTMRAFPELWSASYVEGWCIGEGIYAPMHHGWIKQGKEIIDVTFASLGKRRIHYFSGVAYSYEQIQEISTEWLPIVMAEYQHEGMDCASYKRAYQACLKRSLKHAYVEM